MDNKDHLSNSAGIEISATDTSLKVSAQSRTIAAFDRLLGAIADVPASYLEGIAKRNRARHEVHTKIVLARGRVVKRKLIDNAVFGEALAEHFLQKDLKAFENKQRVVEKSAEYIDADPVIELSHEEVDFDWLNYFETYAEKASTERMQDLWARVLAGEIRKPRMYSLSTMRFLSELDSQMASLFQEHTEINIGGEFIIHPPKPSGQFLLDLTFLEEVGLFQGVSGNLGNDLKPDENGVAHFRVDNLLLQMKTPAALRLNLIRITRIGRELLTLLPKKDSMTSMEAIASQFIEIVSSATICAVFTDDNGVTKVAPIKILKSES